MEEDAFIGEEISAHKDSGDPLPFGISPRKVLRWSTTGIWITCAILLLLSISLTSSCFHNTEKASPILVTPYDESLLTPGSYGLKATPCLYPRLERATLPTDFECPDEIGFCPSGWTCNYSNITLAYTCLNDNFECPNFQVCTKYIYLLPNGPPNEPVPTLKTTIVFQNSHFVAGILLYIFSFFSVISLFVLYECWLFVVGDPFSTIPPNRNGKIGEKLSKFYFTKINPRLPKSSLFVVSINTVVCVGLILLILIAMLEIGSGTYPQIRDVQLFGNCVEPRSFFIGYASVLAWSFIFASIYSFILIVFWFLLNMHALPKFYEFWSAPVFLVSSVLLFLLLVVGVIVELID